MRRAGACFRACCDCLTRCICRCRRSEMSHLSRRVCSRLTSGRKKQQKNKKTNVMSKGRAFYVVSGKRNQKGKTETRVTTRCKKKKNLTPPHFCSVMVKSRYGPGCWGCWGFRRTGLCVSDLIIRDSVNLVLWTGIIQHKKFFFKNEKLKSRWVKKLTSDSMRLFSYRWDRLWQHKDDYMNRDDWTDFSADRINTKLPKKPTKKKKREKNQTAASG